MSDAERETEASPGLKRWFNRLPTGAKIFTILSTALLPLAVIAVFASLQTGRRADEQVVARLKAASKEATRSLSVELVGDLSAIRVSLATLADDPNDAPSCARLRGAFVSQQAEGAQFQIVDRRGKLLCGDPDLPVKLTPAPLFDDQLGIQLMQDRGLALTIIDQGTGAKGIAFFPAAMLANLVEPEGSVKNYGAYIAFGSQRLTLHALNGLGPLDGTNKVASNLPLGNLRFVMESRNTPITSPLLVAMLLPLLMWAAAAIIGWLVVDLLLIRPLRELRRTVEQYEPGEILPPLPKGPSPAQEIATLDGAFRHLTHTVKIHENDLAEGIVRQTKLTREVHHRVKNNLQVIASLINLHSRGATPDAAIAYASIQRRVDALAVVHRHHYAELEEHNGLMLRSVIGELASNLRATAPKASSRMSITLDIEQLLVSQDIAVALAFLITELIELAMQINPSAQIQISVRSCPDDDAPEGQAQLRISSPALVDTPEFQEVLASSYGRVITGLSRQLRAPMLHEPLTGVYEIRFQALAAG